MSSDITGGKDVARGGAQVVIREDTLLIVANFGSFEIQTFNIWAASCGNENLLGM